MIICIGPVCIPVYQLFPVLLYFVYRGWDWLVAKVCGQKNQPQAQAAETGVQKAASDEANSLPDDINRSGLTQRKARVIKIRDIEHFNSLKNGAGVTVVDFSATWCKPCKRIFPLFQELSQTCDKLSFATVDTDEVPEVMAAELVSSLPTFSVYKAGEKVDSMKGAVEDKLKEFCKKAATLI